MEKSENNLFATSVECTSFIVSVEGENIITQNDEYLKTIQETPCLSSPIIKRHGHNKLNNRGDRFIRNTKRLFKNIFHRIPGSAYSNDD